MVILMRRLLVFFWSPLLHYCRQKPTSSRKSAKVLSIVHCGMRVAMDIEVIRDHASRAYQNFWRAGYDVWKGNLFLYLEGHGHYPSSTLRRKGTRRVGMILSPISLARSAAV